MTNPQLQAFIDNRGYETETWWQGLAPRDLSQNRKLGTIPTAPAKPSPGLKLWAFCRWLDAHLRAKGLLPHGMVVRLPTDEEWEKAARGEGGRECPWGSSFEPGRANIDGTFDDAGPDYLRETSPVGLYPQGKSPYCVLDMVGDLWEWCLNNGDKLLRDTRSSKGYATRVQPGVSF